MAVTIVVVAIAIAFFAFASSFFHMIDRHGVQQFESTAGFLLFFDSFIVTAIVSFVALAGLMGFTLGSERMARLFGILWLTETPTRSEFWIVTSIVIIFLGTMIVYALRKMGEI